MTESEYPRPQDLLDKLDTPQQNVSAEELDRLLVKLKNVPAVDQQSKRVFNASYYAHQRGLLKQARALCEYSLTLPYPPAQAVANLITYLNKAKAFDHAVVVYKENQGAATTCPVIYHNMACTFAFLGEKERALDMVKAAVAHGYQDAKSMRSDPELAFISGSPEFRAIMEPAKAGITRLYETFARYPLRAELRQRHARPLRGLTAEDVAPYVGKAALALGDSDELKYLLPRLCELTAFEAVPWEPETLFNLLREATWSEWPEEERAAVHFLCERLWDDLLTQHNIALDADTLLCALGCATDHIEPFLQQWLTLRAPQAWESLEMFLLKNLGEIQAAEKLRNSFWKQNPMRKVVSWLRDTSTTQALFARLSEQDSLEVTPSLFNACQMCKKLSSY